MILGGNVAVGVSVGESPAVGVTNRRQMVKILKYNNPDHKTKL